MSMDSIANLLAAAKPKDAAAAARVAAAHAVHSTELDNPTVWELRGLWNSRSEVPTDLVKKLRELANDLSREVAGGGADAEKAARQETATRALLAAVDGDVAGAIDLATSVSGDVAFLEEAVRANLTPDPEV